MRRGASHDIALNIAAGAQRAQQAGVDPGDRVLQVALQNTVELNALPGCEAKRGIAVGAREVIDREVLLGGQPAARNLATHHEHVVLAETLFLAVLAGVSIFLLIGAMKFQELLVMLLKVIGVLEQILANGAAKLPAALLDPFHGRSFGRSFARRVWSDCSLPFASH